MTGAPPPSRSAKRQRLVLAVLAVVALVGAAVLALVALRGTASYFYVPSDLLAKRPEAAVRLGGMVEAGSIRRDTDGVTVRFRVTDGKATVPATYRGITPDLFVERSGVVAEGRLRSDGVFVADTLLAKHDENYVPRELEGIDIAGMRAAAERAAQTVER